MGFYFVFATGFDIEFVTCSAIRKIFSTMRILASFHLISIMLGGQSEAFFSLQLATMLQTSKE